MGTIVLERGEEGGLLDRRLLGALCLVCKAENTLGTISLKGGTDPKETAKFD